MQGEAHPPQEVPSLPQHPQLPGCQEFVRHQGLQIARAEMPARHPENHVDVAQPARAALDVGFQVVGRVVVPCVPRLLLLELGFKETPHGPDTRWGAGLFHAVKEVLRAQQPARFHERGGRGQVPAALITTLIDGTRAVPDLQPDVPEQRQERRHRFPDIALFLFGQEHEQVHVRIRMQFAPAIPPGSSQHCVGQLRPARSFPDRADHAVDQRGLVGNQFCRRLTGEETVGQGAVHSLQDIAQPLDYSAGRRETVVNADPVERVASGGQESLARFDGCGKLRRDRIDRFCAPRYGAHDLSVAPSVKTSNPSAVTSTVCSHWAESE